jgi:hypothetical protein
MRGSRGETGPRPVRGHLAATGSSRTGDALFIGSRGYGLATGSASLAELIPASFKISWTAGRSSVFATRTASPAVTSKPPFLTVGESVPAPALRGRPARRVRGRRGSGGRSPVADDEVRLAYAPPIARRVTGRSARSVAENHSNTPRYTRVMYLSNPRKSRLKIA